jgi:hypothetical protein
MIYDLTDVFFWSYVDATDSQRREAVFYARDNFRKLPDLGSDTKYGSSGFSESENKTLQGRQGQTHHGNEGRVSADGGLQSSL